MPNYRKPKPLAILHGDFIKNPQRENKLAPEAPTDEPVCPEWLCDVAKERWGFMVEKLRAMNLQSSVDMPALELYCRRYAEWRRVVAQLEEQGYVGQTWQGTPMKNPLASIEATLWADQAKMLGRMGFTPTSRASLYVDVTRDKKTGVARRAK